MTISKVVVLMDVSFGLDHTLTLLAVRRSLCICGFNADLHIMFARRRRRHPKPTPRTQGPPREHPGPQAKRNISEHCPVSKQGRETSWRKR